MTNDDTNTTDGQHNDNVSTDGGQTTRRTVLKGTGAAAGGLAIGSSSIGTAAAEIPTPQLERQGNQLVDPCGNEVVLRGVNIIDPARANRSWRGMSAEEQIQLATNEEWANNVIRLPMQPQDISGADERDGGNTSYHIHGDNWGPALPVAFTQDELDTYLSDFVDPLVDIAANNGFYIQLDYHRHFPIFHQPQYGGPADFNNCGNESFPNDVGMCGERGVLWHGADQVSELKGLDGSPDNAFYETQSTAVNNNGGANVAEAFDAEMELFWSTVANEYAGEPHVLFDIFNEPTGPYAGDWGSPTREPGSGGEVGLNTDVQHENAKPYWRLFLERAASWVETVEENAPSNVKTIGSPRWSQYTYWAKDLEVGDVSSVNPTNMCYTGHRYTHESLQPMSEYYGAAAEEVPIFFNEWGWHIEGGSNDFPFIDGTTGEYPSGQDRGENWPEKSKKANQKDDYETFFNNYNVHPVAWCFDHGWSPSFFEGQEFTTLKDRNITHARWWKDYLDEKSDQDLPMSPDDPDCDTGPEPQPPTAPSNPTTSTSESSITVSWGASTDPNGDFAHYQVEYSGGTTTTEDTEITFNGLRPDTRYEFTITAVDAAGNMSDGVQVAGTTGGTSDPPVSDAEVSIEVSDLSAGGMATADIMLSEAPNGVSGFDIVVSVADTSVVTIDDAQVGDPFGTIGDGTEYGSGGSSVTISGTDLQQNVQAGAEDIHMASVTVNAQGSGTTDMSVGVEVIDADDGSLLQPMTTGASVTVSGPGEELPSVGDSSMAPTDPDDDDIYEDVNGNGRFDYNDIVVFFQNRETSAVTNHVDAYDFNGNGRIDYNDVVEMFQEHQDS